MSEAPKATALRWAVDWAWVGVATSAIAPLVAERSVSLVPESFAPVAAAIGGSSGLLLGLIVERMHRALPERSRAAVLGVLLPLPLGAWGAGTAMLTAYLTAPNMSDVALVLGSLTALLQMMWFVPAYVVSVRRGWQLLPVLLSTLLAPVCAGLGVAAFFALFFG